MHKPINLTPKQRIAAEYLNNGCSIEATAAECRTTADTIREWNALVEFRAYRQLLMSELADQADGLLRKLTLMSIEALKMLHEDKSTPAHLRALISTNLIKHSGALRLALFDIAPAVEDTPRSVADFSEAVMRDVTLRVWGIEPPGLPKAEGAPISVEHELIDEQGDRP
jgi:hypothetical protein